MMPRTEPDTGPMVADDLNPRDPDDRGDVSAQSPSAHGDSTTWTRLRRGVYRFPRRTLIFLIELYRTWVSPMRLPTCRFEPTCSGYAVEALDRHGFLYGSLLAIIRLLKCGPWHKPGYDPVPERGIADYLRNHQHASPRDGSCENNK